MASVLALVNVGAIVYKVRNKAKPIMAIVGGMLCVVKARRIKDKTIAILVKEVIITKRLGRIAKPVKITTSLTGVDQSLPLVSLDAALSITVIKSVMLGTPFAGALVVVVLPGSPGCTGVTFASWPKENPAGIKTTNARKSIWLRLGQPLPRRVLISLPVIYILNIELKCLK